MNTVGMETRKMISDASDRWWLENHNVSKRSSWLQSTLSDLELKTRAMVKLIEEDADSFAKRAEMLYEKRPELISLVEDFYKTHRLLAERYDHSRLDIGVTTRLPTGHVLEKSKSDTCSESCESEVEDPDQEKEKEDIVKLKDEIELLREEKRIQKEDSEQEKGNDDEILKLKDEIELLREKERIWKEDSEQEKGNDDEILKLKDEIELLREEKRIEREEGNDDEILKLKEEMESLREENRIQREELEQKDEEKRDVIRQLSMAFELIKNENLELKKCLVVLLKRNQGGV